MRKVLMIAAAMTLAACGSEAATEDFGNLKVQVAGIHNGSAPDASEIDEIVLTLDGVDHNYRRYLIDNGSDWATTFTTLYTGSYTATAVGYAEGVEIFVSNAQTIEIRKDTTVALIMVMNQQTLPGTFSPPQFDSVVLSSLEVEQGGNITITVNAHGGSGDLTLTGRHAQSTIDAGTAGTFTPATGEAFVDGAAQITWTSPLTSGSRWFVLTVTDSEGNVSELGVTVLVGNDRGGITASATFNLAPTFNIVSRVLNDDDAATFYFFVDVLDTDSAGMLDYVWTSTCAGQFHLTSPYLAGDGELANGSTGKIFKYDVTDPAARNGECSMTFALTDAEGASAAETIQLQNVIASVSAAPAP